MQFRYLVFSDGGMVWGKHEIQKEYFIKAVERGDLIINTDDWTCFDKDSNSWQPINGDSK